MIIKKYTKFSDPGHGWLRVPHKDIVELGIVDKISKFSYQNFNYVYLEEDSDASIFLSEAKKVWNVQILNKHTNSQSSIRGFSSVNPFFIKNSIKVGDRVKMGARYPKYKGSFRDCEVVELRKSDVILKDLNQGCRFRILNKDFFDMISSEEESEKIMTVVKKINSIVDQLILIDPKCNFNDLYYNPDKNILFFRDGDLSFFLQDSQIGEIYCSKNGETLSFSEGLFLNREIISLLSNEGLSDFFHNGAFILSKRTTKVPDTRAFLESIGCKLESNNS